MMISLAPTTVAMSEMDNAFSPQTMQSATMESLAPMMLAARTLESAQTSQIMPTAMIPILALWIPATWQLVVVSTHPNPAMISSLARWTLVMVEQVTA